MKRRSIGRARGPLSLRSRAALIGVGVLALWVLVLTVALNVAVATALHRQIDTVLRTRAEAAAATVQVGPDGHITVRDTANDSAIDVGTWIFDGRTIIDSPATSEALDAEAAGLIGTANHVKQTGGSAGIRWYSEPVVVKGAQVATVVTSLSLAPYRTTQRLLLGGTATLALLLLVAVWFALRAGVGRALRPVAEMTHQSALWSAHDVDRRFGAERRPAELEDLATTLDGLLDRLSAVLRHEKRLSEEISHELRTPMARILTETELLQERPSSAHESQAALATIQTSAQEMSEILELLMTTARSSSSAPPGRCDVRAVIERLVEARPTSDFDIHVQPVEPVSAGVDSAVLERALGPILDNALRFAHSQIDITVTATRSTVYVNVRDDGPGIPLEDLAHVFEPGWRGTGPDPHEGAGLGLALSRRLLSAAGGSVEARPAVDGALLVVVLPSA